MKRLATVALASVVLLACQDSTTSLSDRPGTLGRPNVSVTDPNASYGFLDGYFTFLSPLVENPSMLGQSLNKNLKPIIQLWRRDQLAGTACEGTETESPLATFTPTVNSDGTYYEYGWKTGSEPAGGLTDGTTYRLCVKVQLATRDTLVGWRDVRPAKTSDPNNPAGAPYLFENGRQIPIKFWLSSKSLCYDENGEVIDCTIATFDANGGTAVCDEAQCGVYVPSGVISGLATFEIRYVKCEAYETDPATGDTLTVQYLDIDNPQYFGCLRVTTYANYDWSGSTGLQDGITIAACRDQSILGPQDERLLLHVESDVDADGDNRLDVYALPTRPFPISCDPGAMAQAPGAGASLMDWMRYYAARGTKAVGHALLPFVDPPELAASHAGFGGGTSLKGSGTSLAGVEGAMPYSSGNLASGPSMSPEVPAGTPVELRAVWALPAKIAARYRVTSLMPFATASWIDPVAVAAGGLLYPAVLVTDECEPESLGDIVETCADPSDAPAPVKGAKVTFTLSDGSVVRDTTGPGGIAWAPWYFAAGTPAGTYVATAGGLGIGVNQSLAAVTVPPPSAPAEGAYQEHIGNNAVQLRWPRVRFEASVCSDKSSVLNTPGVEADLYGEPYHIPINISGSGATEALLYVTSDCYNTYFALAVPLAQDLQNSLRVVFVDSLERWSSGWNPGNPTAWFSAVPKIGDDMWFIGRDMNKKSPTYGQWLVSDWHVSADCTGSSKQSECGTADLIQNLRPKLGAVTTVPGTTTTVYEFARCFPGANGCTTDANDFYVPATIGGETWIGFYLVLQMGSGAQGNTEYPDFRVFQPIKIARK